MPVVCMVLETEEALRAVISAAPRSAVRWMFTDTDVGRLAEQMKRWAELSSVGGVTVAGVTAPGNPPVGQTGVDRLAPVDADLGDLADPWREHGGEAG